jgi:hypothetical protein
MMRLGGGDRAGWREDVMALQRYGRLLAQAQTLIQRIVGLGVENLAQECLWCGLEGMDEREARAIVDELRAMPRVPTLAECVDQVERLTPLSELSAMAKYGNSWVATRGSIAAPLEAGAWLGDGVIPVDFDKLMRDSNRLSDLQVAAFRENTYAKMKAAFAEKDAEEERLSRPDWFMVSPTQSAALRIVSLNTMFVSTGGVEQESRMMRNLTDISLVLAIDRARRRAYAESLTELPQEQVRGLDEDFFSGGKLIYRREGKGYTLYSVGKNARDDGGVRDDLMMPVEDQTKQRDDIVLRVE